MKKNININLDRETFKKLSIFLSPKEIGEMIHDIYESATNDLKDILFITEDGVPIKQGDYWYYVVKEKLDAPHRTNTLTYKGNNPTSNVIRFSTEQKAWDYINLNTKKLSVQNVLDVFYQLVPKNAPLYKNFEEVLMKAANPITRQSTNY